MRSKKYIALHKMIQKARANPATPAADLIYRYLEAQRYEGMCLAVLGAGDTEYCLMLHTSEWAHFRRVYIDGGALLALDTKVDEDDEDEIDHAAGVPWADCNALVFTCPVSIVLRLEHEERAMRMVAGVHYVMDSAWRAAHSTAPPVPRY
jgi:hypothetical protein